MSEAPGTPDLDRDNPWAGLGSITEDEKDYFHGRDREIANFQQLVMRGPLAVLFGKSGFGKTSLLNAGLFPLLRQADFLPIYVRFNFTDLDVPLVDQVKSTISAVLDKNGIEGKRPRADETLWAFFHAIKSEFWNDRQRLATPVLVFDQFEEVLTLGSSRPQHRLALFDELTWLVENRVPPAVQTYLQRAEENAGAFDFSKSVFKVILSFREEYVADIEGLAREIPEIMTNRMRLGAMDGLQARDAINLSGGHLIEDGVTEKIIAFLADVKEPIKSDLDLERLEVDPTLLSIICRELNNQRRAAGAAKITADLLTFSQDQIVADFYHENIRHCGPTAKRFIEDKLIDRGGRRIMCSMDDAIAEGIAEPAINDLVSRHILRRDERYQTKFIELTHDVLTDVAKSDRDQRAERERRDLEEAKRHRRNRRLALGAAAVFALLVLVITVSAYSVSMDRRAFVLQIVTINSAIYDKLEFVPGANEAICEMIRDSSHFVRQQNQLDESGRLLLAATYILMADRLMISGSTEGALWELNRARDNVDWPLAARETESLWNNDLVTEPPALCGSPTPLWSQSASVDWMDRLRQLPAQVADHLSGLAARIVSRNAAEDPVGLLRAEILIHYGRATMNLDPTGTGEESIHAEQDFKKAIELLGSQYSDDKCQGGAQPGTDAHRRLLERALGYLVTLDIASINNQLQAGANENLRRKLSAPQCADKTRGAIILSINQKKRVDEAQIFWRRERAFYDLETASLETVEARIEGKIPDAVAIGKHYDQALDRMQNLVDAETRDPRLKAPLFRERIGVAFLQFKDAEYFAKHPLSRDQADPQKKVPKLFKSAQKTFQDLMQLDPQTYYWPLISYQIEVAQGRMELNQSKDDTKQAPSHAREALSDYIAARTAVCRLLSLEQNQSQQNPTTTKALEETGDLLRGIFLAPGKAALEPVKDAPELDDPNLAAITDGFSSAAKSQERDLVRHSAERVNCAKSGFWGAS
jgi:hypothetical protein